MKLSEFWKNYLLENNGHILQSIEWGIAKQNASDTWKPFFLVVTEEEKIVFDENSIDSEINTQNIIGVATVLVRELFFGFKIMYIPRGPVFEDPENLNSILRHINKFADEQNITLLKIEPDIYGQEISKFDSYFRNNNLKKTNNFVQVRDTVFVDLNPSDEDILQEFHKKHRYNIRLAQRRGLVASNSTDINDLDKFWSLYMNTNDRRDDALNPHARKYYEEILKVLLQNKMTYFTFVEKEGKVVSASINFIFGKEAIYMYGGFDYKFRKDMPNHLREWQSMVYAKQKGCNKFDLWGLTLRSDPGGIKRYKLMFNESIDYYIGTYERYKNPIYEIIIKVITKIRGR